LQLERPAAAYSGHSVARQIAASIARRLLSQQQAVVGQLLAAMPGEEGEQIDPRL